ncbi:uncharacterized protein LOC116168485 [Photinus pyralis]|uniref:uncharacterized protein LOC116168485 n=1 Tax=Photinus pyralis TaxID=7054 RepID=UPI0012675DF7|nr:uncharacterized protein LOC116168485 [Photinus pyralis]
MKRTLWLLSVCTSAYALSIVPQEFRAAWVIVAEPHRVDCECKTKVSPDLSERALSLAEMPGDSCLKCYLLCICEKLNLINPATFEFNVDEIVRTVAGMDEFIASNCVNASSTKDPCEKVYQAILCSIYSLLVPYTW